MNNNIISSTLFFILISFSCIAQVSKEFFVSKKGSDRHNGTMSRPFKTIEKAQQAVRAINKSLYTGSIQVQIRGGNYNISQPLIFLPQDGGNDHCAIYYAAYKKEKVIFEAGYKVTQKWKIYKNGIYTVQLNNIRDMRQLYVNGQRMARATTTTFRQADWAVNKKAIIINKDSSFQLKPGKVALEFVQETHWRLFRLPIDSVKDLDNQYELSFQSEAFSTYTNANLGPFISPDKRFSLENNLAFINQQNEWFFDANKQLLYFKPSQKINLGKAEIYVPLQQKIIDIQGSSSKEKVENLHFSGITFQHSNWLKPSVDGVAPLQSTILVNKSGTLGGRIPGCITANFINTISFTANGFEHLGASALYLENGINNVKITGNIFTDISGAAIHLGNITHEQVDDGQPETSTVDIANNVLRDIAVEYAGSAAISAYYISNTNIAHNDIDGTGYSAISTGWGWSEKITSMYNNLIDSNRIFNVMQRCWDGAPIYTLSKQAHSGLKGNYVGCLNMAQHGSAGLYHDQGSAGFTDENNVIEVERPDLLAYMLNDPYGNIVRNNYANTGNAIVYFYDYHTKKTDDIVLDNFHIVPDAKWPSAAQNIIRNAGLQPAYKSLLTTVRKATPVKYETAYFESPFVFNDGKIIMEAENYASYKGLEQCNYSWIGVKAWFTGYSGSRALMSAATPIGDHRNFSAMPMLAYNIKFNKAGDYYLYIRAKGDSAINTISWGFNNQKIGELKGWEKEFSWQKPVKITIAKSGVHQLCIWMKSEKFYLDKIMIAATPNVITPNNSRTGFSESKHLVAIPANANYLRVTQ